jgi:hypothetical protein
LGDGELKTKISNFGVLSPGLRAGMIRTLVQVLVMSSLQNLSGEIEKFYLLLDAIGKIDGNTYLQGPEYQLILSLKAEVEKWT